MEMIGSDDDQEEEETPRELMGLGDEDDEEDDIELSGFDEEEEPLEFLGLDEEEEEQEEGEEGTGSVRQRIPGARLAQGLRAKRRARVITIAAARARRRARVLALALARRRRRARAVALLALRARRHTRILGVAALKARKRARVLTIAAVRARRRIRLFKRTAAGKASCGRVSGHVSTIKVTPGSELRAWVALPRGPGATDPFNLKRRLPRVACMNRRTQEDAGIETEAQDEFFGRNTSA